MDLNKEMLLKELSLRTRLCSKCNVSLLATQQSDR